MPQQINCQALNFQFQYFEVNVRKKNTIYASNGTWSSFSPRLTYISLHEEAIHNLWCMEVVNYLVYVSAAYHKHCYATVLP